MNRPKRYIHELIFPRYAFIPGVNKHPNKKGGHMYNKGEPIAHLLTQDNYFESKEYLYAIDLFNYEYFWESHTYFEAIWNAHQRKGEIANLMKAFIKIAAAGVKDKIKQPKETLRHLQRARDILDSIEKTQLVGIKINDLKNDISKLITDYQRDELFSFFLILDNEN